MAPTLRKLQSQAYESVNYIKSFKIKKRLRGKALKKRTPEGD